MSINNYTKDEFGSQLNTVVFPTRPIRSVEHLKGREIELESIQRALYQDGRHVFIYGDRGVGKSSLGATAAFIYQSPDAEPIFVSGSVDDTFKTIIANIANQALSRSRLEVTVEKRDVGIEWRGLKWSKGNEVSVLDIASQIQSVGDATELLKQVAKRHSDKPIVVIDEFDTISDAAERNKFASLLKQLGDQSVALKFIFTAIGKTLEELLGAHQSAFRQLETIELFRLSWEARVEIVYKAVESFNLGIDDNVVWRIAIVSDGFPYYVQLMTEKMLWEVYSDELLIEQIENQHYQLGLRKAIQSIHAELKRPYEQAVVLREEIYETVVWATSDGENLQRSLSDMYASYKVINRKRDNQTDPVSQLKFSEYIRRLKNEKFGGILLSLDGRLGWYVYKEKMLRGYVRMQAEASGIELSGEKEAPKQKMHIQGNVRTGYKGPSIPRGVRLRNDDHRS